MTPTAFPKCSTPATDARLSDAERRRVSRRLERSSQAAPDRERRPRRHVSAVRVCCDRRHTATRTRPSTSTVVRLRRAGQARPSRTGSFVLDLGGAYQRAARCRSLYHYRVLLRMCDEHGFFLAEEFFWHNPAKLPSPIEWVNKRKLRAKDSVNTVWWLSKTDLPKADVRNVLAPYSERMKTAAEEPRELLHAQASSLRARHQQPLRHRQRRRHPLEPAADPEHREQLAYLRLLPASRTSKAIRRDSRRAAGVLHQVPD